MAVTIVWNTWLKPGAEAEGLRLARPVWSDMRSFEAYLSHQILVDQDAPGITLGLVRVSQCGNAQPRNLKLHLPGAAVSVSQE
jgi:hypothetical protein